MTLENRGSGFILAILTDWLPVTGKKGTVPGSYVLMLFEWWNKENKAKLEWLPRNLKESVCRAGRYRRVNCNRKIYNYILAEYDIYFYILWFYSHSVTSGLSGEKKVLPFKW